MIKVAKVVQRATIQDSQLLLKFMANGNAMAKGPMSGALAHLMANTKECYDNVLAQSESTTELMLEGREVDWNHFDIKKWSSERDYDKAVLHATNATNGIGNLILF